MVQFEDFYKVLGVERTASQAEISKAYRKLARKYHPDLNKEKGAEAKFKKITAAYEVLDNPEKRKKYDQFGSGYADGQEFRPPPGFDPSQFAGQAGAQGQFSDFGEFFEAIFGAGFGGAAAGSSGARRSARGGFTQNTPEPVRAELSISATEFLAGGSKRIAIGDRSIDVRIPVGLKPGASIRLAGLGGIDRFGAPADLLVKINVTNDARYKFEEDRLITTVDVPPGIAAVGGPISCDTPQGVVKLNVPAGVRSGQRMRLGGKGRLVSTKEVGDLYVDVRVQVPKTITAAERELYSRLAEIERGKSGSA